MFQNPASSRNQTLLPVMVFYYGGGFIGGCSDEYGPDYIISNDVILVTSNYRLAAFGKFFCDPKIAIFLRE